MDQARCAVSDGTSCPYCHRLPSVLLRDTSGDVQESDELARDADLSSRSAYLREGQRPHPQVGAQFSFTCGVLWKLTAGIKNGLNDTK